MAIFEKPKPSATAAPPEPALQEQLAALLKTKQGLLDRAKPLADELNRLRGIRNPAYLEPSVRRYTNREFLLKENKHTDPSPKEDPAEVLRKTLAGERIDVRSIEERIHQTSAELNVLEDALEYIDRQLREVSQKLARAYANSKKPDYDALIKRLAKHLPEVKAAAMELQALRSHLRDNGSLGGLFSIELPEFLMGHRGELASLCEQLKGFEK
jgi:hypothetical protein